jgi:methylenetetrahydrofolate reductase (NADPH)
MEVSLEIVPRNISSLQEDAVQIQPYRAINCINIPDLPRFNVRSWEGCAAARAVLESATPLIPHLRARDIPLDKPFPLTDFFRKNGISRALVIAGDPSPGEQNKEGDSNTIGLIKKIKAEMPELEIYAGFDPYRTNIRYELDYLTAKEQAGATGFMSQPFFDLRLLALYAEYLEGKTVFWGTAPVLGESSKRYWESRNRALFPRSFMPDIIWNITFARQALDYCKRNGFNLYLMPMKTDIKTYLSGIWPSA